jgi:hypothetical protein
MFRYFLSWSVFQWRIVWFHPWIHFYGGRAGA